MIYKVTQGNTVWSNKFEKYFYEGEEIPLSHASAGDIATLVAMRVIEEVKTFTPVFEPKQKTKVITVGENNG